MTFLGQEAECKELNNLLESLLTINGCLRRLDCETQDVYLTLPRNDLHYIMRVAEQNPNGKFFKFYKRKGEDEFMLGSIKVRGY